MEPLQGKREDGLDNINICSRWNNCRLISFINENTQQLQQTLLTMKFPFQQAPLDVDIEE